MKTFALALLAFAAMSGLFAQPQLNYLSLNEGLTLTYDPGTPEEPQPQPYRADWWVHSGRAYYLEATADLEHQPWHLLPKAISSYFVGDYRDTYRLIVSDPKYFVRLRYIEGRRMGHSLQHPTTADIDHDGVSDDTEFYAPKATHPLQSPDADEDGLPDDWEKYYFSISPPPENQDEDPANDLDALHLRPTDIVEPYADPVVTAYQRFKRDWVKGLCIEYGGEFFWNKGQFGENPYAFVFAGDQNGSIRLTYTDADLSTVATLEVFPRTNYSVLVTNNPVAISAQARALYTYINDSNPALRGYAFSATTGYLLITDPETQAPVSLGAPDGRPVPRDLLRSIDTMLWPEGLDRPQGATQPLPLKRAVVSTPGGPEERRIPAKLAITSRPVTVIGRDRFPVVVRESSHELPRAFLDFQEDYIPSPGPRIVEQAAESEYVTNPVMRTLDADSLPQGVPNPELYPSAGPSYWNNLMFRSPLTFARWYRDNSAQGYVVQGINQAYAPNGFSPPGYSTKYYYGFYSGAEGFYPHRDDVNEIGKFTTELHGRLNYTPDTKLYLASNDDCWVYVNGKLVDDLDVGGIPPIDNNTSTYQREVIFSDVRSQLGLSGEAGTCRLDIFHADRFSQIDIVSRPRSQVRVISTTSMLPIYCYQVVAESSTSQPLTYSLSAPIPGGITISPTTGKILWDLYANPAVTPGTYPVTVQVTDPIGNSDTQTFNLTILD